MGLNSVRIAKDQVAILGGGGTAEFKNNPSQLLTREELASRGSLFRALVSNSGVSDVNVTFIIPAGKYMKIMQVEVALSETGINEYEVIVKYRRGGSYTAGTSVETPNYNDLYPKTTSIIAEEDAGRSGGVEIELARRFVNSTNQTSDNELYTQETPVTFGSETEQTIVSLEISAGADIMSYIGGSISFAECDVNGDIL